LAGEKTKGRKRHIVVDVMGTLLAVVVHAANIHDTKSGIKPAKLAFGRYPSIKKFCADAGYRGTFVFDIDKILGLGVGISEKTKPHEWEKLSWRWIVERTLSWLNNHRRLSGDYGISIASAEAAVKISHAHTLLKRL
jgi:putative transposase